MEGELRQQRHGSIATAAPARTTSEPPAVPAALPAGTVTLLLTEVVDASALAQRWDWCGPALGIDAECAGGLVALLQAADALALVRNQTNVLDAADTAAILGDAGKAGSAHCRNAKAISFQYPNQ